MRKLWQKFVGLFTKTFQVFEEHKQINLIQSIGKDEKGYTTAEVIPVGADRACTLYPHDIMNQPLIQKQFMSADIKLIKAMLIAEGDIFVESKEYHGNTERYFLRSLLNQEKWTLTRAQLEDQSAILNRINKRFFGKSLNQNLLII